MPEPLRAVEPESIITGWDFSTGAVKCVAFDLHGNTVAEVRLPTDLWTENGVSELNLMQLEGQARASVRAISFVWIMIASSAPSPGFESWKSGRHASPIWVVMRAD